MQGVSSYLGMVNNTGAKSDQLVQQGIDRGNWYVGTGEEVEDLGNSIAVWISDAVSFLLEFGPDGREVRAVPSEIGEQREGLVEVCVALAVVLTRGGLLVPVKYEMRLAQVSVVRAADNELRQVQSRPQEWSRRSYKHSRAAREVIPWWRFCVRAASELKTSRNGRQYYAVKTVAVPTSEVDLQRLQESWSNPEWQVKYRDAERSAYSRVNYLLSLC